MTKTTILSLVLASYALLKSQGQGTIMYDQQSSDESYIAGGIAIQPYQPIGQSFTPTLSSIGFIRIYIGDNTAGNSLGATLHINLLTNSITGPVLATTDPMTVADGFNGVLDFYFSTPQSITPGATYLFRPIVDAGDIFIMAAYNYNYPGGTEFVSGSPSPNGDVWFREGSLSPSHLRGRC